MADIEPDNKPDSAEKVEATVSKTLPKWVRHLSAGICTAFDCQAIHNPAVGKLTFIGVGADVQIAVYTFAFLDRTVRRLCSNYVKHHVPDKIASRHRELMRQSYYLGAVSTINEKLRSQKQQTPITPGALVPVKQALIKKTMSELGPTRTVRSRRSYINANAYNQGQQDGKQVGIHHGIGSSTMASKTIAHK
jgi:hypothetical protein